MSTDELTTDIMRFAGVWVAILEGEVVAARPTPWALLMELHERDIVGATVMRSPDEDAVELVGLG